MTLRAHKKYTHEGKRQKYKSKISKFEEPTKCSQCDKTYIWKSDLKSHVKAVHEGVKFKCKECDHESPYSSGVREHWNRKHRNEKLKCKECNFETTVKGDLKRHKQKHSIESFVCKLCNKKLKHKSTLIKHKHKHLKEHKKETFICVLCDYENVSDINLQEHMVSKHGCKINIGQDQQSSECSEKIKT